MVDNEGQGQQPVDSNKEATDMNCELKVGKCLTAGAKTAEEVEAALKCLREEGKSGN